VTGQCWDTDSYSAQRQSVVFHHVRTVPLSGHIQLHLPEAMVGCRHRGERRLFVLGVRDGLRSAIYRVDPVSGVSDHAWRVDAATSILSVAPADNQLLVATPDLIELYETSGHLIRSIPTAGLPRQLPGEVVLETSLMTDSMYDHTCTSQQSRRDRRGRGSGQLSENVILVGKFSFKM